MGKTRIYQLAKDIGIESKELVKILKDLGADVKNHMSTIDEETAGIVREIVAEKDKPQKKKHSPQKFLAQEGEQEIRPPRMKKAKKPEEAKHEPAQEEQGETVRIDGPLTVRELAALLGKPATDVISRFMEMGVMANINQSVDSDVAAQLAEQYGFSVERPPSREEEILKVEEEEVDPEKLEKRAPVVTVMGHVDHGKTSLLDAIRETDVTAGEAGGITQHIGASQIEYRGEKIVFLDTPGHEAFTTMRARGAQVTDIAILVVAADDGVMPQTVEAINHAKAAKVPIIVAINKMDLPGANPDRVKQQLSDHGLLPEEWGGNTICVSVSAVRKEGLDHLLEMVLLVAEMEELKADRSSRARGVVIESEIDRARGPVGTFLVQNGTLRVGDAVIAGSISGKVRAMFDDKGNRIDTAGPATPVEVLGLSDVPRAGDSFRTVADERKAREIASLRHERERQEEFKRTSRVSLDDLFAKIEEGVVKELNVILKADTHGTVEAVRGSLEKLSDDRVKVVIIHQGVGAITENDVMLAAASDAVIIGFNVRPEPTARREAEREGVDIRTYRIIYELINDMDQAKKGMLEPRYREITVGRAEVRALFKVPKVGTVAGCYVTDGKITSTASVQVLRNSKPIYEGRIANLKRFKEDVKEVQSGYECGILLDGFNDVKEGDFIEAFAKERIE